MVSDRFRTFPGAFGSDALLKTASRVRTFWEMTHRPTSAVVLFYFIVCRILCQPLFYTGNILILLDFAGFCGFCIICGKFQTVIVPDRTHSSVLPPDGAFPDRIPSQTCFFFIGWHIFRPSCHRKSTFLYLNGTFFARRTIATLLFFTRWYIFRPAYHRNLTFLYPMVYFSPDVPSQTYFSLSNGIFCAQRAIINLLF
jgi:hypothetical protein